MRDMTSVVTRGVVYRAVVISFTLQLKIVSPFLIFLLRFSSTQLAGVCLIISEIMV